MCTRSCSVVVANASASDMSFSFVRKEVRGSKGGEKDTHSNSVIALVFIFFYSLYYWKWRLGCISWAWNVRLVAPGCVSSREDEKKRQETSYTVLRHYAFVAALQKKKEKEGT